MRGWWIGVLAAAGVLAVGTMESGRAAEAPAAKRPIADFAQLPGAEGAVLAPGGKSFAAKVAIDGKQYFAVTSLESGKPRVLQVGEVDLNWWRWVGDDWLVVGIGQLSPVEGEEWYVTRVVAVDARTMEVKKITPSDAAQTADDVVWIAKNGSPQIMLSYQTSIYPSDPGFWPRVDMIDMATGKRRPVQQPREGVTSWYADGGGAVRIGVGHSLDGRSTRVLYRDGPDRPLRTIDRARTRGEAVIVPALFTADKGKAMIIGDDAEGFSTLYDFDLTTLQRGRPVFATKGFDIGGLVTDETGYRLLGVRVNEDKPAVRWMDPDMLAMEKEVGALVKGGRAAITSVSRDRQLALVNVGGPDASGATMLFERATKAMTLVSYRNPAIQMRRLNPVRTLRYKARDGLEIAAVLTMPKGRKGPLPLIVMPHGGPFARDTEEWDWWTQFLADRGYAVVQPNYRGSSGYGTPFTAKGEGQWGLAMQDDLNDAVTALAAQGVADPKRVCMVGASYGGYAALRAAQRDGKLYRCAVSYAGVADLNGMVRHDSRFLMSGARKDWMRKQAPDLKAVSPANFAGQFSIPTLLVHGAKDRVVPVRQSRGMAQRLRGAGKEATYLEQPLADHHFTRSEDRRQFLEALETFLTKHNPA